MSCDPSSSPTMHPKDGVLCFHTADCRPAVPATSTVAIQPRKMSPGSPCDSPAVRPLKAHNTSLGTPMIHSFSNVLSEINALPSPFVTIELVASESLERNSHLTERALRSQSRDAVRATAEVLSSALLPSFDHARVTASFSPISLALTV